MHHLNHYCEPPRAATRAIAYGLRLAAALWQRKLLVATALAVGVLVGGAYDFAAERTYRAEMVLLLSHESGESPDLLATDTVVGSERMATYVELLQSGVVLDGALARVQELPPAARVDFAGCPREAWSETLAQRLSVAAINDADMIVVGCQSADPDAAPLLVEAVITSFIEYIKRRHKQHATELLASLQRERLGLDQRLLQKRQTLDDARQRLRDESRTSPLVGERYAELQRAEIDAQRVSAMHEALARRILTVETHQAHPPLRCDIVSTASGSPHASGPRFWLIALTAVGGGLLLGVAIVVVLDATDDRFRSPLELRVRGGAPLLASVGQLPLSEGSGLSALQMHAAPHSAASEAFRTLRAALDRGDRLHTQWAFTSARAGDGKTTILANLAVACAHAGRQTLVIDADLRRGGLTKLLNVRCAAGLVEVLAGGDTVSDLALQHVQATGIEHLHALTTGRRSADGVERLCSERMSQLIAWASETYDRVLIDAPPLLAASDALVAGRLCDGIVLVMQPEVSQRHDVQSAVQQIIDGGAQLAGFVANRVGARSAFGGSGDYAYRYGESLLVGDLHDDGTLADEAPNSPTGALRQPTSVPSQDLLPRRVA